MTKVYDIIIVGAGTADGAVAATSAIQYLNKGGKNV